VALPRQRGCDMAHEQPAVAAAEVRRIDVDRVELADRRVVGRPSFRSLCGEADNLAVDIEHDPAGTPFAVSNARDARADCSQHGGTEDNQMLG